MCKSAAPLSDGLTALVGNGFLTNALIVLALAGLLTTIHGSTYAYGRVIFALSRAGYFPRALSKTGKRRSSDAWATVSLRSQGAAERHRELFKRGRELPEYRGFPMLKKLTNANHRLHPR
jgi:hypothetical protein